MAVYHYWQSSCVNCHSSLDKIINIRSFCFSLQPLIVVFLILFYFISAATNSYDAAYLLGLIEQLIHTDVSEIFYSELLRFQAFTSHFSVHIQFSTTVDKVLRLFSVCVKR